MAKLTVSFKDKIIHHSQYDHGIIRIGRDDTNDIIIDSLAVAPAHAVVIVRTGNSTVKQMNYEFPLWLNGESIKEAPIKDNDVIAIGKHSIRFNDTGSPSSSVLMPANASESKNPFLQSLNGSNPGIANLQILNGENIGKIIAIKKTMMQIGKSGNGMIAISRRKDGYFVSVLENMGTITLNDRPISENSVKLNNNDVLVVNGRSMQFFLS